MTRRGTHKSPRTCTARGGFASLDGGLDDLMDQVGRAADQARELRVRIIRLETALRGFLYLHETKKARTGCHCSWCTEARVALS